MNKIFSVLMLAALLPLTACLSQDQADAKMVKGCKAAISSLIAPKKLLTLQSEKFSYETNKDDGKLRRVALSFIEKDGWIEMEQSYHCLFLEQWGFMKASHKAMLIQIHIQDEIIGKVDGNIQGGFDNFLKITDTVDRAMGQ